METGTNPLDGRRSVDGSILYPPCRPPKLCRLQARRAAVTSNERCCEQESPPWRADGDRALVNIGPELHIFCTK